MLVRDTGLEWTIVRLPEIYGGGGREGLDRIVELARNGKPIPIAGAGEDEVCPLYIGDAIDGLAGALEEDAAIHKTYTLGGDCISIGQFVAACRRAFSNQSPVVSIPNGIVAVASLAARIFPLPIYPDQLARLRAAKPRPSNEAPAELGFTVRPLADGLRASAER